MAKRFLFPTFSAGELAPDLYGNPTLEKAQQGLTVCENFIIRGGGSATRRAGTRFVGTTYYDAANPTRGVRLIPFKGTDTFFDTLRDMVFELGHQYLRAYCNGIPVHDPTYPIKAISAIVQGATPQLTIPTHGLVVGDLIYIEGLTAQPALSGQTLQVKTVPNVDTVTVDLVGAEGLLNTTGQPTAVSSNTVRRLMVYTTPLTYEMLGSVSYAQKGRILTITHYSLPDPIEVRVTAGFYWLELVQNAVFGASIAAPTGLTVTIKPGPPDSAAVQYSYQVSTVSALDFTESLPSAVGSSSGNNLNTYGHYNEISWPAVPNAYRYNVYKRTLDGAVPGFIGTTDSTTFRDYNIIPDAAKTPVSLVLAVDPVGDDWKPSAVTYHEQRRWFAKGINVYATRSGTDSNFLSSTPSQDDDAMEFGLDMDVAGDIRHLLSTRDLLCFSSVGVWKIFSASSGSAITPTTANARRQGEEGCAGPRPVQIGNSMLYASARTSRVVELKYSWESDAYVTADLCVLAPHLFEDDKVYGLSGQALPTGDTVLWSVFTSGKLAAMTYLPDLSVYAWHRHEIAGATRVLDVCCASANGFGAAPTAEQDAHVYLVVDRVVNGITVRSVEYLPLYLVNEDGLEDAHFVDGGRQYSFGGPVTNFGGLVHLEGQTVAVFADGAPRAPAVVSGGKVTLAEPATKASIGLPMVSRLQTLPLVDTQDAAAARGLRKNVTRAFVRVRKTQGLWAGPSFDNLTEYIPRDELDPYGSPPALQDGDLPIDLATEWTEDGTLCIEQRDPLPLTILSAAIEVEYAGR